MTSCSLSSGFGAKKMIGVLCAGIVALLLCLPASAQLNLGRIFGGVTDASGGAIAGATVKIVDVERGITRPLVTDGAGEYSAPGLTPGTYTVIAEDKGFKTLQRENVVVGVGADVRVDLSLQPGEQTQTVTVTGEIPQVDTSNAQLQETIDTTDVASLPIQGRQYRNLLLFNPAVVATPGSGSPRFTTYNGIHAGENNFMFDGLYAMSNYINSPEIGAQQANIGPDQATILPVDAIQEINVIGEPKAEYGWGQGMQVNVGLKSGTNDIHGTAFGLGRDSALNARNQFLTAKAPYAMEQFGGSVGGPIKKNKVFYFADYEGQRLAVGIPKVIQEPTAVAGAGVTNSLPDAIAALNKAHIGLSQLSLNLAGCTAAGVCNAANGVIGNSNPTSSEATAALDQGGSDNGIIKVDYHLNDRNSLNGEYYIGNSTFLFPSSSVQAYWRSLNPTTVHAVRAVWLWTPSSNWVNEARFGYDHSLNNAVNAECFGNYGQPNYATQFGFIPGTPAVPQLGAANCAFPGVTISGFSALGGVGTPAIGVYSRPEGSEVVSYTHGKHLFKFGGEAHYTSFAGQHSAVYGSLSFGTGGINDPAIPGTATPLEDFLAGYPSTGSLLAGGAYRVLNFEDYAAFIQDDWRITSRITLNLGLRWEAQPAITAQGNLIGNFDPSAPEGLVQQTSGHPVYKGDDDAFGPRVGLAWDVTGNGTTVVRAGGSILRGEGPTLSVFFTLGAIPTGFSLYAANGTLLPSPGNIATGTETLTNANLPWAVNTPVFGAAAAALACGNGIGVNASRPPCSLTAYNQDLRLSYVTGWNLGIQHAFTSNIALNLVYIGNHGTDLPYGYDLNQPTAGASGSSTELVRRPYYSAFPYLSSIQYTTTGATSNYDGLQATLSERLTHGLSYTVGYTYGHSVDDNSDDGTSGGTVMDALLPHLEYGNGTYDIRNHFTMTASYAFPGVKTPGQLLEGWKLNTALNVMGGLPVNADDTSDDISGTGINQDRWTLVGTPNNFTLGGPSTVPCFGATGSSFAKAGCSTAVPAACTAAAATVPTGPTGQTGPQALAKYGCYMEGSAVIVPPAQGTYGTMGRDVLRGLPFHTWDLSLIKDTRIRERYTIEFRAEFFNVLNQPHYIAPSANLATPTTFGQSASTPDSSNPVIGNGGPREIQLGLKLTF